MGWLDTLWYEPNKVNCISGSQDRYKEVYCLK